MPYFDYPDNVYINPYYLDVTPDIREEMRARAALYSTKTRSVGVKYGMYDSVATKNIEWPYQKIPWAKITSLFKPNENYKPIELGLAYDKEMSDENGKLVLYGEKRNTPSKPLLTGLEISNEGQRGSLLKGKFSFTYFPELLKNGFDLLDLQQALFTPGREVHIAFGWSTYASNIRVNKLEFAGVIFGFNWTFNPNMSISAEVQIVSPSSLAIGFSGDQTVNDESPKQDSVVGKLPDATNLITVIDKDLRGQQELVELNDGSIVGWLPKTQTTTQKFDYVLVKLPITGGSSYLDSSAANLQSEEWTAQTPEVIIEGSDGTATGTGTGDGGGTDQPSDNRDLLKASNQNNWLKSVKNVIKEFVTSDTIDGAFQFTLSGGLQRINKNGNPRSVDWFNLTTRTGEDLSDTDGQTEMLPGDPETFRTGVVVGKWLPEHFVGTDGASALKVRLNTEYQNNREVLDLNTILLKQPGLSKQLIEWKKKFTQADSGELYDLLTNENNLKWFHSPGKPNYIGGFAIPALIREMNRIYEKLEKSDSSLAVILDFLEDLINVRRVEELHYLKIYRIWNDDKTRTPLFSEDGKDRYIYPTNFQGAGFDEDGFIEDTVNGEKKILKNIEAPLVILNNLSADPNTARDNMNKKINEWIFKILDRLEGGDTSNKTGEIVSDTTRLSQVEYIKQLKQYKKELEHYKNWVGRNQRTDLPKETNPYNPNEKIEPHLVYGNGLGDQYKQDSTKVIGGIDKGSLDPNMYAFGEQSKPDWKPSGWLERRAEQKKYLDQILNRIDEILNPSSDYYLRPYRDAVIKELVTFQSETLKKKLNQGPQGSGTEPAPDIVIPPTLIVDNRTYWYIKLGDLVGFANTLVEQYAKGSDKDKYTFPLFKMVAHGNETDYNKAVKSAYPVDVYFPDIEMGTYGAFKPFSVDPMSYMLRTFFIQESSGAETTPEERKARIATDVINIGEILIGIDYIRKTYRNFLHENSTKIAYKNITNFFEDIVKRINLATGDIYQLSVMLFEEPERLTSALPKNPKRPAYQEKDGGTNRRALLSLEDSNLSRRHTITVNEGENIGENESGQYYRVRPYNFEANIMKPLIKNVSVTSRPSKEATFAAYIAARGEEAHLTNPELNDSTSGTAGTSGNKKAPPMSVDVDLAFGEWKDKAEFDRQQEQNRKEKAALEERAEKDGFNERWSDTYRGILTKWKRLKYKPDPDGTGAHWLNMAIYPIELTLTIDGINGFKFGDVIKTNLIPSHYNERWNVVFTVTKIIHKVTPSTWETTLNTAARLPLDGDPNEGISELGPTQPAAVGYKGTGKREIK